MATTSSGGEPGHATADREIVMSRVISAPRELVFEAFTRVRHLSRWWGPEGFSTTTRSFEFRVGVIERIETWRREKKWSANRITHGLAELDFRASTAAPSPAT